MMEARGIAGRRVWVRRTTGESFVVSTTSCRVLLKRRGGSSQRTSSQVVTTGVATAAGGRAAGEGELLREEAWDIRSVCGRPPRQPDSARREGEGERGGGPCRFFFCRAPGLLWGIPREGMGVVLGPRQRRRATAVDAGCGCGRGCVGVCRSFVRFHPGHLVVREHEPIRPDLSRVD